MIVRQILCLITFALLSIVKMTDMVSLSSFGLSEHRLLHSRSGNIGIVLSTR